jgi:cyclase
MRGSMLKKALSIYAPCAVLLFSMGAAAQYRASKAVGNDGLDWQFVKTGLYVISGGGDNTVLRLSANGSILVNGKRPGNYDALLKRARKISDQPVRVLIVTNYRENHIGNNAKFLADHTAVIAQQNVKQDLAAYDPPNVEVVPPTFTYDREYTLRLGAVEARLFHFGNAVTSGDTVVYFPNLKAVAVGDLFASTPNPDFAAGGSLVGWGLALAQVLKLDFDVAVPGDGTMVTKADLEAFKTRIDTLVARGRQLVKDGVSKDQLMARLKTDDLGWHLNFTKEQVDGFYAELSKAN